MSIFLDLLIFRNSTYVERQSTVFMDKRTSNLSQYVRKQENYMSTFDILDLIIF